MNLKELSTEELISLAQNINSELIERREKLTSSIIIKYDDKTNIRETDLSIRAKNALRGAGIDTVGELKTNVINKTPLFKIRGIGEKTMKEIELFISENV